MWSLKCDVEGNPLVVREGEISAFNFLGGHGEHAKVLFKDSPVFSVKLWSHNSCALAEFYNISTYPFPHDSGDSFVEWLKTQPFKQINSWEHKIFTLLPGDLKADSPTLSKFLKKYCTIISTFPNHAHGGHLLNLYQLDLTKCS